MPTPDRSREPRPESPSTVPPIGELLAEREVAGGWEYDAHIAFGDGSLRRIALRLSWSDYHHWSPDGAAAPSRVVEAVLQLVVANVERFAGMESIDASTARRRVERADATIAAILRGQ